MCVLDPGMDVGTFQMLLVFLFHRLEHVVETEQDLTIDL
jgi:hypothetical protein